MLQIGDVAPLFSGQDVTNGESFSLESQSGIVLVAFAGISWCHPCQLEAPLLQELWVEFEQSHLCPSVQFVMVSVNDAQSALQAQVQEFGITFPVIINPVVPPLYEVTGVPTLYIVAADKTICAVHSGYPGDPEVFKQGVRDDMSQCGLGSCLGADTGQWQAIGTILFGVTQDGGGLVLVGGKPRPVGPWDPLRQLGPSGRDALRGLAMAELAANMEDAQVAGAARTGALSAVKASVDAMIGEKASGRPQRTPARRAGSVRILGELSPVSGPHKG